MAGVAMGMTDTASTAGATLATPVLTIGVPALSGVTGVALTPGVPQQHPTMSVHQTPSPWVLSHARLLVTGRVLCAIKVLVYWSMLLYLVTVEARVPPARTVSLLGQCVVHRMSLLGL